MNFVGKNLFVVAFLLMTSCGGKAAQISSDSNFVRIDGDVIKINLGRDFPGSIAVTAPGGKFYVVRDDEIDCQGIDVVGENVILDSLELSGVWWDDGRPHAEMIFTAAGEYKIVLAENLETELDGANASVVAVRYAQSGSSATKKIAKCTFPSK